LDANQALEKKETKMNIKKKAMIVVIAAGLAFAGLQQASARGYGGGHGGGHGSGYGGDCSCAGYGPYYQQMDEETKSKIDAFRSDTLELRKQIAMKKAEKRALMNHQNPDPAAVSKVVGDLFELRSTMQAKAKEAGVPMMGGKGGMNRSGGKGGSVGRMMPCANQQNWN